MLSIKQVKKLTPALESLSDSEIEAILGEYYTFAKLLLEDIKPGSKKPPMGLTNN